MSSEPEFLEDAAFERKLLESARGDIRPREVKEAWARFAGRLSLVHSRTGRDVDVDVDVDVPRRVPAAAVAAARIGTRATWGVAVKYLVLGAIGGSGLTAAVMIEGRRPTFERPAQPAAQTTPAPAQQVDDAIRPPEPAMSRAADRAAALETATELRPPATRTRPPRALPTRGGSPHRTQAVSPRTQALAGDRSVESSTLAAEVARIDAARTAMSIGDYTEASQLIERYHSDFPNGVLGPDAEVVALELAAAEGDAAEIARRARSFLLRHPNDPHAARVKWLVEHFGR